MDPRDPMGHSVVGKWYHGGSGLFCTFQVGFDVALRGNTPCRVGIVRATSKSLLNGFGSNSKKAGWLAERLRIVLAAGNRGPHCEVGGWKPKSGNRPASTPPANAAMRRLRTRPSVIFAILLSRRHGWIARLVPAHPRHGPVQSAITAQAGSGIATFSRRKSWSKIVQSQQIIYIYIRMADGIG